MKKYVLVKYPHSDVMYVLLRSAWRTYVAAAKSTGGRVSYMVAESDNRTELERFRELTEEN